MDLELDDRFQRRRLMSLNRERLKERVIQLNELLNEFLKKSKDKFEGDLFSTRIQLDIIERLRSLGHDIWSWDYDGTNVETWGCDYMKDDKDQTLYVQFHRDWKTRCDWIEKYPFVGDLQFLLGVCDLDLEEDEWLD